MSVFTKEDTIRITATFDDFDGEPTDLDEPPTVKLFTTTRAEIEDLGAASKTGTGEYRIEFVIPEGHGTVVHEWRGQMGGQAVVRRGSVSVRWLP